MLPQGMGRLMLHRMGMWKDLDDAAGDVEAEGTDTAGSQPAVSVSCVANAQDELRCTSTLVVSGPTSAQLQGSWTWLLWLVQVILDISISEDGDPTSSLSPSQSLAALLLSVCFQAPNQGFQHHNVSPPSIQCPLEQNPSPRLHAWWVQGCCLAIRSTAMTCSSFAGTCFE